MGFMVQSKLSHGGGVQGATGGENPVGCAGKSSQRRTSSFPSQVTDTVSACGTQRDMSHRCHLSPPQPQALHIPRISLLTPGSWAEVSPCKEMMGQVQLLGREPLRINNLKEFDLAQCINGCKQAKSILG